MVQCFKLNEENNEYFHTITALYQYNNRDYGINDYISIMNYRKETKQFKRITFEIDRNNLRELIGNPKLKLEAI